MFLYCQDNTSNLESNKIPLNNGDIINYNIDFKKIKDQNTKIIFKNLTGIKAEEGIELNKRLRSLITDNFKYRNLLIFTFFRSGNRKECELISKILFNKQNINKNSSKEFVIYSLKDNNCLFNTIVKNLDQIISNCSIEILEILTNKNRCNNLIIEKHSKFFLEYENEISIINFNLNQMSNEYKKAILEMFVNYIREALSIVYVVIDGKSLKGINQIEESELDTPLIIASNHEQDTYKSLYVIKRPEILDEKSLKEFSICMIESYIIVMFLELLCNFFSINH